MAREIQQADVTRIAVSGSDTAPAACQMDYRVINIDGSNDDLLEPPAAYVVPSPNFNQTVTLLCTGTGTTVKTNEGI